MITAVTGVLVERRADGVVIQTDGGIGYAVVMPLGVFERLPTQGQRCSLLALTPRLARPQAPGSAA